ncbi:hypothetical protein OESDEN_10085 [Oesophagostomum dentatum]|uniref:Uncharacterized protein n=1 Tax=Oesophagostomum dentatum TaxID=61180 RepID=A0A0B1SYN4_OESDE|nr:hypothetical protein OESDEN_10085 [Oesophagostomum dentatum]
MLSKTLLLSVLFAFLTHTAELEQCSSDASLDVKERKVDHGALSAFFSIAQGIADGLQPVVSNETLANISICSRTLLLVALVFSAAFILTGLIINNQSSSRLFSALEGSNSFVREFTGDVRKLYNDSLKSVICTVDRIVNKTLGQVECNVRTAPTLLLDRFKYLTGIALLDEVDWQKLQATVSDTSQTSKGIRRSIQDVQASSPSIQCETKLIAMKATLDKVDTENEVVQIEYNVRTAPTLLLDRFKYLTGIALLDEVDWQKLQATVNDTSQTSKGMRKSIQDVQASSPSIQCETKLIAMKATLDKVDSENEVVQVNATITVM